MATVTGIGSIQETLAPHRGSHGDLDIPNSSIDVLPTVLVTSHGKEAVQYQCPRCTKRYKRYDHLKRHYRSHIDSRPYFCHVCSKSFNRKLDLLARHRVIHEDIAIPTEPIPRAKIRTTKACLRCIAAKTKCSDGRPCQRCMNRGEICLSQNDPSRLNTRDLGASQTYGQSLLTEKSLVQKSSGHDSNGVENTLTIESLPQQNMAIASHNSVAPISIDEPSPVLRPSFEWIEANGGDLPCIWDSAFLSNDVICNVDDDTFLTMDLDWSTLLQPEPIPRPQNANDRSNLTIAQRPESYSRTESRVLSGLEAFQRSVWNWDPDPRDSATLEEVPQLTPEEEGLILPCDSTERRLIETSVDGSVRTRFSCRSDQRDELLLMVQDNSERPFKIRSFPSPEVIGSFVTSFITREQASPDPFVHITSLVDSEYRIELLGALVVAGAAESAIPQVSKFGMALQERTRQAVYKAFDYDNSIARRLDIIQAQILWFESGLWSGNRRKIEVAESAANNVPTMIRRSGIFHLNYYEGSSGLNPEDGSAATHVRWQKWTELEAFKRCVCRAIINDMQRSAGYMRPPSFYSTDFTFVLPAARTLWDASDSSTWKTRYFSQDRTEQTSNSTLLDVVRDPSILKGLNHEIDCELSLFTTLHCLWPQISAFLDSKKLYGDLSPQMSRHNTRWLEGQRQELYTRLADVRSTMTIIKALTPEALIVCELFMMSLFVSCGEIQRLAGQFGLRESQLTLPNFQAWLDSDEPRYAMWHAGQVLKAAGNLQTTRLRGFYAIAVYQACLTLALPFLLEAMGNASVQSQEPTSRGILKQVNTDTEKDSLVILNDAETIVVKMYLQTGKGIPAFRLKEEIKGLSHVEIIPTIMADLFERNHMTVLSRLPPLPEKLVILIMDLAMLVKR